MVEHIITCDCGSDYGELPKVHREKIVRARKQHQCCECGESIEPGELYEYTTGLWEDWWGEYKTCIPCRSIRGDYCTSFVYGDLKEALWECLKVELI